MLSDFTMPSVMEMDSFFNPRLNDRKNMRKYHYYDQGDQFSLWEKEHLNVGRKWEIEIDPEKKCGGEEAFRWASQYVPPEDNKKWKKGERHWSFMLTNKAIDGSKCKIYFKQSSKAHRGKPKWWKKRSPGIKAYKIAVKDDGVTLVDDDATPESLDNSTPWSCGESWYPKNLKTCWADQAYQTCHNGNNQWAYDNVMKVGGSNKAAFELYTKYKNGGCPTCNVAKSSCEFSMYPENKNTCWADDAFQKCHGSQLAYDRVMAKGGSNEHAYCHWKELVDTDCDALKKQ